MQKCKLNFFIENEFSGLPTKVLQGSSRPTAVLKIRIKTKILESIKSVFLYKIIYLRSINYANLLIFCDFSTKIFTDEEMQVQINVAICLLGVSAYENPPPEILC